MLVQETAHLDQLFVKSGNPITSCVASLQMRSKGNVLSISHLPFTSLVYLSGILQS